MRSPEVRHNGVENKLDDGVDDFQFLRGLRIENQCPENVKQRLHNPKLPEDVAKQLFFQQGGPIRIKHFVPLLPVVLQLTHRQSEVAVYHRPRMPE